MTNRELDALVAEKVMGWTDCGDYWQTNFNTDIQKTSTAFSSDIAWAWQVVEKIGDRGLQVSIYVGPPSGYMNGVEIDTVPSSRAGANVNKWSNEPVPLLICHAALEALNDS